MQFPSSFLALALLGLTQLGVTQASQAVQHQRRANAAPSNQALTMSGSEKDIAKYAYTITHKGEPKFLATCAGTVLVTTDERATPTPTGVVYETQVVSCVVDNVDVAVSALAAEAKSVLPKNGVASHMFLLHYTHANQAYRAYTAAAVTGQVVVTASAST